MTNTITRTQAKKWTICAQLASGVCVLGAIALGVVDLPEPSASGTLNAAGGMSLAEMHSKNTQDANAAPKNSSSDAGQSTQIDTVGLALRFALLDNAPKVVSNVLIIDEPGPMVADPDPNIGSEIAKRVKYIGFINDPENRHAFIRIDGRQRVVSVGSMAKAGQDGLEDLKVERIAPGHIVLSDGKTRAKIELANRSSQSITMVSGTQIEVTPSPETGSLLSAEDEARIAAMPKRQQPGARRRLERERRGLSPTNEPRRPTPEPLGRIRSGFSKNAQESANRSRNE
ncbi:hypothetical protein COB72_08680 [bacterium]|nr:MAG: hypothetical protein COB72_08680 [bacterium]